MIRFAGGPYDGRQLPDAQAIDLAGVYNHDHADSRYVLGTDNVFRFETRAGLYGLRGVAAAQAAWRNLNRALGHDTDRLIKRLDKAARKMRRAA
jgi:hypothetical protein